MRKWSIEDYHKYQVEMKRIHEEDVVKTWLAQNDFLKNFDEKMKDVTTTEDRREKLKSIHSQTLKNMLDKQTPQFTKWHAVSVSLRARARTHTHTHTDTHRYTLAVAHSLAVAHTLNLDTTLNPQVDSAFDHVVIKKMSPKEIKERVRESVRAKNTMARLTRAVAGWGAKVAVFDNKKGNYDMYFVTNDNCLVPSNLQNCEL